MPGLCRTLFALAAWAAGTAPVATAQLPPSTATFGGVASVSVPMRMVHGLVVIPVRLNGHGPLQMILDTGAPVILVPDTALASRLQLQVVGRARVDGAGDGEVQTAPLATGVRADVGAFSVSNAVAIIGVAGDVIPGVDGVIGGALFRHAVVHIDWDAGMVHFHDPASQPAFAGEPVPLRVAPSLHAYLPSTVDVNGDSRPVELHLDTGARQALSLSAAALAGFRNRAAVAIPTVVAFGSRGAARGDAIRVRSLTLGPHTLAGVATVVPDRGGDEGGRVGMPVLRRFNTVIDYPGARLILAARDDTAAPFPFTTTGLVLAPGRDGAPRVVAHVISGSPAEQAGMAAGDSVLTVDGNDVTTLAGDALSAALITPAAGRNVTVVTRRDGARIERRLDARTLLP